MPVPGEGELPGAPGGVRPGQLGVVMAGGVIIGDIAATVVDLVVRGVLGLEESASPLSGGWMLTPVADGGGGELLKYERVLLGWLARPGSTVSFAALARDLAPGLDEIRSCLVHDGVHRGWLHRLRHHERTEAAKELAGQVDGFQHELQRLKGERGDGVLAGALLPYALHFGLADPLLPLVRFGEKWVRTFARLPGWQRPALDSVPAFTDVSKPSIDEQMMNRDVGAMLWITGAAGW